ncbi:MAG: flagellar motor protein MotB [Pseudomonadota bacterium]
MADSKDDNKPTIIVKKGGHGGHHGGAWKIAYADFTTAMMCFFLCMWLINTASITTRQAIASYFRKPSIFQEGTGQPLLLGGQGILDDAVRPLKNKDPRRINKMVEDEKTFGEMDKNLDKLYQQDGRLEPIKDRGPTEVTGLNSDKKKVEESRKEIRVRILSERIKGDIERLLNSLPPAARLPGSVEMRQDPDGLSIDIMDTDKFSMFDSGSSRIRPDAEPAFKAVTDIIKKYPNFLEIYGHTDAQPFPSHTGGYTNWELSADRANTARRLIQSSGYSSDRIVSITGKAASELRKPDAPLDPSNRRITLKLRFQTATNFLDTKKKEEYNDPLRDLLEEEALKNAQTALPEETPTAEPTISGGVYPPPPAEPTPSTLSTAPKVQLPDGPANTKNPDFMPKDKIFEDNPVLGPRDL